MRILLLVATALGLALASPNAAASPTLPPCDETPLPPACGVAEGIVTLVGVYANETQELLGEIVEAVPDQPGHVALDVTYAWMCGITTETPMCRAVSGRPVTAGAFELCGTSSPPNAPLGGPYWYAIHGGDWRFAGRTVTFPVGADPVLGGATTTHLAGTPLEGESICHDHWPTLYALATLP